MPFRFRKQIVVLCLAIAVFSVAVPAVAFDLPVALLTPVWMYEPPAATVVIADDLVTGHEQTRPLRSVLISRGPPAHLA